MCQFESKERCRRGAMLQFVIRKCANPCVFTINRVRGVAKASGVRRCARSGLGAASARTPSNSGHSFALKFGVRSYIGGSKA